MMLFCFSPLPNPMQIALFCPFDWPKYLLLPLPSPNADRPLEKVLAASKSQWVLLADAILPHLLFGIFI
jgi:hypothetical protein